MCTDAFVSGVRECASDAGAGLDENVVAVPGQLEGTGRRERDAVLVRLDLLRNANPHSGRTLYPRDSRHAFGTAASHLAGYDRSGWWVGVPRRGAPVGQPAQTPRLRR